MNQQLTQLIEIINTTSKPLVIGIDGKCGAGKTTLAKYLEKQCHANVFHMDDYFLRLSQRTKERYEEAGGNVDRERFKKEIGDQLHTNQDIVYTPFDCKTMSLTSPIQVKPKPITIVEGSYSMHPTLIDLYDLKIFMTISDALRIQRIQKRNPDKINDFMNKWIPFEEKYFKAFHIQEKCDYVLDADTLVDELEMSE